MKKSRDNFLEALAKKGVNILIINERGPIYFVSCFQSDNDRTICLAYRFDGSYERNHNDSVSNLRSDTIYKCANYLSKLPKGDIVKNASKNATETVVITD